MRSDGGHYNTSIMQNIADFFSGTLVFLAENGKIVIPALVSGIVWFVNRENDEDIKRKPELIDQVVINGENRCAPQKTYPQLTDYKTRLRQAVEQTRSAALDRLMTKDFTVCLNQHIPDFRDGKYLSNSFYAAYHYNEGQPVLSLWDKGKGRRDKSFLEDSIDRFSAESLDKFAQQYLANGKLPHEDMIAIKRSRSCGKSCTKYYIDWRLASDYQPYLTEASGMKTAPLLAERVPVEYKLAR